MYRKIIVLSLVLFHAAHGMESSPTIPMDVMPSIIKYALYDYGIMLSFYNNEKALRTIQRKHTLQLVCKDFKRMFWDCFTLEEKDFVIRELIYTKKKKESKYLCDIAISMKASLAVVLCHVMGEGSNPGSMPEINEECVRRILAIDAKSINVTVSGFGTPLYLAARLRRCNLMKLLLSYPMIDVNKTFPLYWAIRDGYIEVATLLLAHPNIEINAVNEQGETALFGFVDIFYWTSTAYKRDVVDLLINAGIDSTITNNKGETALDFARRLGSLEVIKILEQALAKK